MSDRKVQSDSKLLQKPITKVLSDHILTNKDENYGTTNLLAKIVQGIFKKYDLQVGVKSLIYAQRNVDAPLNLESVNRIIYELGIIQLTWPTITEPDFENRTSFPETYHKNSNKEKLLLAYAENFRRQFFTIYPYRKPLLMQALNECGLQKMVCTTIRPTRILLPELLTWHGCATFVADYCSYEPLENPILMPARIISPGTVLRRRKGNAFELSTLLVSLMQTAGFEAFVVVGRATKERCLAITDMTPYTEQISSIEEDTADVIDCEEKANRYSTTPFANFESQHLLRRERQRLQKLSDEERSKAEANAKIVEEIERPPIDELRGWRIHSWVLIRSKVHDFHSNTKVPFYIEPSTGTRYELDESEYLSVESVYDHRNYYVNLNVDTMPIEYDLDDRSCWERLLCQESIRKDEKNKSLENDSEMVEKHLDMPASWVEKFDIAITDIEQRYPNEKKTVRYKKCILEKYAPYSRNDGLVKKVTYFQDYECTCPLDWYEWYENRSDYLSNIFYDHSSKYANETYIRGRNDHLKVNKYDVANENGGIFINREMEYFNESHPERLSKIVTTPTSITEIFVNRCDRLHKRIFYYKEIKTHEDESEKILVSVYEKFLRNHSLPIVDDVAEKIYVIEERCVKLVYHNHETNIVNQMRRFKIPSVEETGGNMLFNEKLVNEFNIPKKNNLEHGSQLQMYETLCKLNSDMQMSKMYAEKLERRMNSFIHERIYQPTLIIPLFNTERNEEAKCSFEKNEKLKQDLKDREMRKDGLLPIAPFVAREGASTPTKYIKNMCVEEFKKTELHRQCQLQNRYEERIKDLEENHVWYLKHQYSLSSKKEEIFWEKSHKITAEIESIEVQLKRKQDLSGKRFKNLLRKIRLKEEEEN